MTLWFDEGYVATNMRRLWGISNNICLYNKKFENFDIVSQTSFYFCLCSLGFVIHIHTNGYAVST